MKNQRTNHTVTFALERRVCMGIGVLIAGLVVLYTFFLSFSIAHVTLREEYVHKTNKLSEETAALEKQYLTASSQLTESNAHDFGLVAVNNKVFVERQTLSFQSGR